MAKMICLVSEITDGIKNAILGGKLNPDELMNMSSQARRDLLSGIVGPGHVHEVNSLIESKLILKNQKQGIFNALKKLSGLSGKQNEVKLAERAQLKLDRMNEYLDPNNMDKFLEDFARDSVNSKFKIEPSAEEVQKIVSLTDNIAKLKEKGGQEYGNSLLDLQDYVEEITPANKENIITTTGGAMKALEATADLSAPFRQGRDYLGTKEWNGAFKRMFKYASSYKAYREFNASVVSHPLYEMANKAKLSLTSLSGSVAQKEEQFISKWSKKLPLIANSERAYAGFLSDLRFNRFVNIVENSEKNGIPFTDEMARDLAGVINSGTGRGSLGSAEIASKHLSEAIWSPKMLKSRLDLFFNLKSYTTYSAPARKEQWGRLLRLGGTTAAMLGLAKAAGADIEVNPLSSDFGKAKFGKTRFDMTGGYGAYVVLAARLATGKTKSTTTGEIKNLDSDEYGSQTRQDVIVRFLTGKGSPLAGMVNDIATGKDYDGNNLRVPGALPRYLESKVIPLVAQDIYDAYKDGGTKKALEVGIPSLFGISTQTYNASPKTKETLTDSSNASLLTKLTGLAAPKPRAELQPVIKKLNEENITLNMPGSSVKINPEGNETGRKMTDKELKEYQKIYKNNLIERMTQEKDNLMEIPGSEFAKYIDSMKRDITEQSKNELISGMLR